MVILNYKVLLCREMPGVMLLCFIYVFGQSCLLGDKVILKRGQWQATRIGFILTKNEMQSTQDDGSLHQMELQRLGDIVQKRLQYIQNPTSCDNRRKLQCNLHGCGLGCQINSVTMCLMIAYALNRTVIVRPELTPLLQPISLTCTESDEKNRSVFNEDHDRFQVIERDFTVKYKPSFSPPALPDDLKGEIERYHDNPELWWTGQVTSYVFRPTQATKKALLKEEAEVEFQSPVVGVHIRRSDKLFKEARFHAVDEYMKHVEEWFDRLEETYYGVQRKIFLATDDMNATLEIKERYPGYTVINNASFTSIASSVIQRRSETGLYGIIHDIHLLSKCDFLVCTYTSNVCRVAVQLMTASRGNVTQYAVSLDRVKWSFAGPKPSSQVIGVPMPHYEPAVYYSKT